MHTARLATNADRAVIFNQAKKAHIKTAKKWTIKSQKAKNKTKSRCRLGSDHVFDALWYNIIRKGKQTGLPSGDRVNIEINTSEFQNIIIETETHFSQSVQVYVNVQSTSQLVQVSVQ